MRSALVVRYQDMYLRSPMRVWVVRTHMIAMHVHGATPPGTLHAPCSLHRRTCAMTF
jgi:hypothetical protein